MTSWTKGIEKAKIVGWLSWRGRGQGLFLAKLCSDKGRQAQETGYECTEGGAVDGASERISGA